MSENNAVTGDVSQGTTSDTSIADNWRESLPEPLRDSPYFKNAKSVEDAATQIANAAYWQGNSILKPGANASDEAKAANKQKIREMYPEFMPVPDPYSEDAGQVFAKMGKPDSADKYKLPEGFEMSPDEAGAMKAIALDANLTQAQFEKQQAAILTKRQEMAEQQKAEQQTGLAALREQWGATYDQNMAQVNAMLANDKLVPPAIKAAAEAGTLDAQSIQWLNDIARRGDEQTEVPTQQGQTAAMTPEQGRQEAQELRARLFSMNDLDPMKPVLMAKLIEAERYSIGTH